MIISRLPFLSEGVPGTSSIVNSNISFNTVVQQAMKIKMPIYELSGEVPQTHHFLPFAISSSNYKASLRRSSHCARTTMISRHNHTSQNYGSTRRRHCKELHRHAIIVECPKSNATRGNRHARHARESLENFITETYYRNSTFR